MINVEVRKNSNENTASLIRRFTKKVQGSGVLSRVRSIRHHSRPQSEFVKKKQTLRKIKRKEQFENLYKQGKVEEKTRRRFRR